MVRTAERRRCMPIILSSLTPERGAIPDHLLRSSAGH
jgi:hypothetical protein